NDLFLFLNDLKVDKPIPELTLKSAKQDSWENAYKSMREELANEFERHDKVLDSGKITEANKQKYIQIRDQKADYIDYAKSIAFLSKCLYQYYEQKVIILIDEYDVPLENAYYEGFYEQMIKFIRSLFESALKTNPYLEFSVITGCLRISKESIFTGLNNLKIISILSTDYGEYYGFVEEVKDMLRYYGLEHKLDTIKEWYDGYCFGETEVFNPWSVINYVDGLISNEKAFPIAAWSNTSSNSIVKDLIERSSTEVQEEIEMLVNGGTIEKKVHEDITYDDIYKTEDNLWNFLFFTGYLKQVGMRMENVDRYVTMAVPNKELLYIYQNTIETWFKEQIESKDLTDLYQGMLSGDVETFERELKKH
ncbi:MAG: AAA family ATPase, partial [Lachnospiraceae bacterium]|nr:AAA family ATPase [Lachnospiraceae bacterium]